MLGDSKSVALGTAMSSSILKKKHCAINQHRCHEALASKTQRVFCVDTMENPTHKTPGNIEFIGILLFRDPKWKVPSKMKNE